MALSTWNIEPNHTSVTFSVRHMMVMTVRGQFKNTSGTIQYDPENVAASSVEAIIDATTVETGAADRDNHLRSPEFLNIGAHPTLTFKSTSVQPTGAGKAKIEGHLTIAGTTKPVTLDVEHLGVMQGAWGETRAGFTATTTINREEWGLTWNMAIEAGGVLVGKDITISLDVQALPAPVAEAAVAVAQ